MAFTWPLLPKHKLLQQLHQEHPQVMFFLRICYEAIIASQNTSNTLSVWRRQFPGLCRPADKTTMLVSHESSCGCIHWPAAVWICPHTTVNHPLQTHLYNWKCLLSLVRRVAWPGFCESSLQFGLCGSRCCEGPKLKKRCFHWHRNKTVNSFTVNRGRLKTWTGK